MAQGLTVRSLVARDFWYQVGASTTDGLDGPDGWARPEPGYLTARSWRSAAVVRRLEGLTIGPNRPPGLGRDPLSGTANGPAVRRRSAYARAGAPKAGRTGWACWWGVEMV